MYSFYINQKEEIDILNDMLADGGGCSIVERANQYHIPLEIACKCDKEKVPKEKSRLFCQRIIEITCNFFNLSRIAQ